LTTASVGGDDADVSAQLGSWVNIRLGCSDGRAVVSASLTLLNMTPTPSEISEVIHDARFQILIKEKSS
jgi:hypothetical protein